jgi:hypothetical protein
MIDIFKKINFPQTSQVPEDRTRIYTRRLTRVLDDLKRLLMESLVTTINQEITNIYNELPDVDLGDEWRIVVVDHELEFQHFDQDVQDWVRKFRMKRGED